MTSASPPASNCQSFVPLYFFFNDTATTEIYTLSLHDALPISTFCTSTTGLCPETVTVSSRAPTRSEEHTSELQSHSDLVCRLLLEKKKKRPRDGEPGVQSHGKRIQTDTHRGGELNQS